jgi:tetratricopeptide (TPR) repeat protein
MLSFRKVLRLLFPTLHPGDGWRTGLALALFAAAVQAVFLIETFHSLFFRYPLVDAATYYDQALGILQGQGSVGTFWQPPGYPYLLALFCAIGNGSVFVARAVQALLLAPLAAVLLWRVGRRVLSPNWACAAAIAASLTGPLLFYHSQLLAAAPAAVLTTAVLLLALRAMESPSASRWLLAGVVNGLAMLFVATTAALAPVLAVFAWERGRPARSTIGADNPSGRDARAPRFCRVAALLVGVLLAVLPVALRNYDACGKWVWLSNNGGTNFYLGNNRDWNVTLTVQPGFDWDKLMRMPYLQNGVQDAVDKDRQFARMAWQDARRAPRAFAQRLATKAAVFWHGRELPRNLDIYGWRETSQLLRATVWRAGVNFPCGLLVPLALVGACALRRRREGVLLAGAVVAFGLLVACYFPCSRYRVPMLPIIVLLACAGAQALTTAVRARAWQTAGALGALALAAGAAVNLPLAWPTDSIHYDAHLWNAIGVAADVRRDLDTAKHCYEEAVRRDPKLADAQFNLGTIFARHKDSLRAETCYEAAIAARADYDKARVNLAIHLADRNQVAAALHQLVMAEALNPLNTEAFANHAAVLQRVGRNQEALEMLRRAAAIDPRYRATCRALEQALQPKGR